MKLRTHTCKAVGCQHVISARLLMCLDHWHMVPVPLRREIVGLAKNIGPRSWRPWPNELSDRIEAKYSDAVARAVAAVAEKQGRKAAASAGASGSLFT